MRGYEDKDPDDLTAMFRIAYDVAVRRCDVCERCGKAPVSKALRIKERAFDTPSNLLAVCDACYDAGRRELTSDLTNRQGPSQDHRRGTDRTGDQAA